MLQLGFDNTYARELEGTFVPSPPQGFPDPVTMTFDTELAAALGLPELSDAEVAALFSGGQVAEDSTPIALAYAGHQFGGFSPQLGDGRAVLLGELVTAEGQRYDLQLKGSGRTVFSRGGDGHATVGPILRELLVSHAMHHLKIPTTRVLATVRTGRAVRRQQGPLPGAVLARVAKSHLRVGTFEFFAARRQHDVVRRLVRYTLARHAPHLREAANPALALLGWVADGQARLVSAWMGVGFVHGVMNTDNVSICGETLDYGPCAFIDAYDPAAVFSAIDHGGRYAFENQPGIAQWNLARLGEALMPVIDDDRPTAVAAVKEVLGRFAERFGELRLDGLRRKLGLGGARDEDVALADDLLTWMHIGKHDHTATFRALAHTLRGSGSLHSDPSLADWLQRWRERLGTADPAVVADQMDAVNPLYIARNHLVEEALDAAIAGDLAPLERFMTVLGQPFTEQPGAERYAAPPPADFGPYTTFCGT